MGGDHIVLIECKQNHLVDRYAVQKGRRQSQCEVALLRTLLHRQRGYFKRSCRNMICGVVSHRCCRGSPTSICVASVLPRRALLNTGLEIAQPTEDYATYDWES